MREKRIDFELLRLLAILGVVFNHSQSRGYELFMAPGCSTVNYVCSLLLGILCKTAVPLFLLVSGGLLLDREESLRDVMKKRVLRILAALAVFSGVLYLFWIRWGYVEAPGPLDFLRRLWSEGVSVPYWYLYAYLGLMLALPLLRPLARSMSDLAFRYLAALHLIFYGGFYTLALLLDLGPADPDFSLIVAAPYPFYFLMGYYLAVRCPWERFQRKQLGISWLLAGLATAAMFGLATLDFRRHGTLTMDYHECLIAFPTFAVYATIRRLCAARSLPPRTRTVVAALGGCVFGTYLLEGILRHYWGFVYEALEPRLHVLPACVVWVVLVVASGLALTWVLKRVPLLNRIL